MSCLIVACPFYDKTAKALCPPHKDWATRILADPRYRTEQPPSCIVFADKVQGVLL
jgi:hypothetical protein